MNNFKKTGLTELTSSERKEITGGAIGASYVGATGELLVWSGDELMVVGGGGFKFIEMY